MMMFCFYLQLEINHMVDIFPDVIFSKPSHQASSGMKLVQFEADQKKTRFREKFRNNLRSSASQSIQLNFSIIEVQWLEVIKIIM